MNGLRFHRIKAGLSIQKLAKLSGHSVTAVNHWDREIPPHADCKALVDLATVLNVPLDEFQKTYPDDIKLGVGRNFADAEPA